MCSELDRRRTPARGECGRPAADVRLPRLLSAVHRLRRRAALPRGAGSVSVVSGFRAGPPRVGGTADPGRRGLLLLQLRARAHRRLLSRAGRRHANPSWTWTPGTRSAAPTPGWACLPTTWRRCWSGSPKTGETEDGESAQPQTYLVPIDACYEFVGRLRMLWRGFDGGQQARQYIDSFFAQIADCARDARDEPV